MTDPKLPADDADDAPRAAVESGSPVAPAGLPEPDQLREQDQLPEADQLREQDRAVGPDGAAEPTASATDPADTDPAATDPAEPDPMANQVTEPAASATRDAELAEPAEAAAIRDTVTVRRSPRYGRFIVLGVGAGAVVTFVLTNLFEIDPEVGFGALFGYLLLFGIPIGAAVGGLVAVLLDAITSRRSRTVEAERTTVDAQPEEDLRD